MVRLCLCSHMAALVALDESYLAAAGVTPEAVRAFLRTQVDQSVAVLRAAGVRPE